MDLLTACLVNCCQGKDAGVLFRITQFINTLALDVIQVLDSGNCFNLATVNTVPCMCAAALSLLESK